MNARMLSTETSRFSLRQVRNLRNSNRFRRCCHKPGGFEWPLDGWNRLKIIAAFCNPNQELLRIESETVAHVEQLRRFTGAYVFSVRQEKPRLRRIGQVRLDHFGESLAGQLRIAQVEHHLHALVNISMHPVRAAKVRFRFTTVAEYKCAAVFEKAADHASYPNPAADSAQPRSQGTGPAHYQLDLNTRLRSAIQRLDNSF